jgi:hypothetical protein
VRPYHEETAAGAALLLVFIATRFSHLPCLSRLSRFCTARRLRSVGLVVFLLISGGQFGHFCLARTYQIQERGRLLAQIVPPGSVILGDWAPSLCLDTRIKAIPVFEHLANDDDPVARLHADYVLIGWYGKSRKLWNRLSPGLIQDENHVTTFVFDNQELRLYRVPNEKNKKIEKKDK